MATAAIFSSSSQASAESVSALFLLNSFMGLLLRRVLGRGADKRVMIWLRADDAVVTTQAGDRRYDLLTRMATPLGEVANIDLTPCNEQVEHRQRDWLSLTSPVAALRVSPRAKLVRRRCNALDVQVPPSAQRVYRLQYLTGRGGEARAENTLRMVSRMLVSTVSTLASS